MNTHTTLLIEYLNDIFALNCSVTDNDKADRGSPGGARRFITNNSDTPSPLLRTSEIFQQRLYQCLFMLCYGVPGGLQIFSGREREEVRYDSCRRIDKFIARSAWLEFV